MYITKDLAQQMEACFKQSHLALAKQYKAASFLEIQGGLACYAGQDSFFSQVVGWGFATPPSQFLTQIKAIEQFYKSLRHPRVDIELCPLIGNELVLFLGERGYRIAEVSSISLLDLNQPLLSLPIEEPFSVKEIEARANKELWAKTVALGFGYPEAIEQFSLYASSEGVRVFGGYFESQLVAGATMAVHGKLCDLAVTSTLPAYRGRGLQRQLLQARLKAAQDLSIQLAMVATEPGSISDLNVQKTGFQMAYTRIKLTLDLS